MWVGWAERREAQQERVTKTRFEVLDAGPVKLCGAQRTPLGFAVLSPTYRCNRSHGRSIRLLAATEATGFSRWSIHMNGEASKSIYAPVPCTVVAWCARIDSRETSPRRRPAGVPGEVRGLSVSRGDSLNSSRYSAANRPM